MNGVLLICIAKVCYFASFGLFKSAAGRMRPLTADRPVEVVVQALGNPSWLLGLLVVCAGMAVECAALAARPLAVAVAVSGTGLALLLLIAVTGFGERLTGQEWLAMLVIAVALLLIAVSAGLVPVHGLPAQMEQHVAVRPDMISWGRAAAFAAPSVLIPLGLFCGRDSLVGGRHARRLTGVAYGAGAGTLLGTALVAGLGLAGTIRARDLAGVFGEPYLYVVLTAGAGGLGLLQVALQRCRLVVLITVATVTVEIYRLVIGGLAYSRPWPHEWRVLTLRIAGLLLAALAVLAFPRHEKLSPQPARRLVNTPRKRMPGVSKSSSGLSL